MERVDNNLKDGFKPVATGFVPYIDQFGKSVGFWVDFPARWTEDQLSEVLNKRFPNGMRKPVYETIVLDKTDLPNLEPNPFPIIKAKRGRGRPPKSAYGRMEANATNS